MNTVWNGYEMVVLGDLNGRLCDGIRNIKAGSLCLLGDSDNGMKVMDFCVEKMLPCISYTLGH